MKKTINYYDFRAEFRAFGREEQFTRQGLKALFDYLEELGDDCGEEIELDVIALCCEYVEYDSLEDFQLDYNHEDYPDLDSIMNETTVIPFGDNSFIIAAF
jgi:hypothetical protein